MSILLNNTVLKSAEAMLEQQIPPQVKTDYLKIVVSGLKVALSGGPNSPFAKMVHATKDPIKDCVNGAIGLCLQMRSHATGAMPMKAMVPACMTLMLHALDLVDRAGVVKVGKPELAQATRLFMSTLLQKLGISDAQLGSAAQKVHSLTQDPANLEKMNIAAGLKAAPGAQVVSGDANGV